MKKHIITTLFLAMSLAASAQIIMEGSTTVLPLAQRTAEVFMNNNSKISISVRGGGSGVGMNSLIAGTADIANSSRAIKDGELQKAAGKNISPKATVAAMDAIALIVNPQNKISGLTKEQVKDIYVGKTKNWKEIGGNDANIVAVSRDSSSGTFEAFNELALEKTRVRKDALMQASNRGVAGLVAATPGAIGYVGLGYLSNKTKTISVDGVMPSVQTVLQNKYLYSRPLFMYTNGEPKGEVKQYLDFVTGKQGQKIAQELGYVPLQ
ncbi:MAG: phosphate ABC transporter substrate-binding protein [Elusimicrobiota bacterium]|nr:phosphate ABC transporter substrate-binding protein [Elusimicrobiota bacterium]